jgi:hypothetical protein
MKAIREAIKKKNTKLGPMLDEYFHFVEFSKDNGNTDPRMYNGMFIAYHFKRHPSLPSNLQHILDDQEVVTIAGQMIVSEFGNYWN